MKRGNRRKIADGKKEQTRGGEVYYERPGKRISSGRGCVRARARHVDAEVEAHVEAIGVPMLKQLFSRGPRLIG